MLFLDCETKQKTVYGEGLDCLHILEPEEYFLPDDSMQLELHRMKMAWTCFSEYNDTKGLSGERWKFWRDTKKFNEYILSLTGFKRTLYLFGHNIFFDLQSSDFFYYFTQWGWVLDFLYDKGLTYILVIRKGKRTIKCISTTNYFDESLEKLGEFLGVRKMSIDFKKASDAELKRYCKRDVRIIRSLLKHYLDFIDKHKLGRFALAKGGQAFTAWRYRFMKNSIYPHSHEQANDLEQKAYMGGRVECRFLGQLPVDDYVSLDVNGLYGHVMVNNEYPAKLINYHKKPSLSHLQNCLNNYCCTARVELDTDEPAYGVRKKFKLIFPTGKFTAFLNTTGLQYALEHGHIKSIREMSVYLKADLFSEYIKYFTKLKSDYGKSGDKIMRKFSKYMTNTLYGKFGQREDLIEYELDINYTGYFRQETYDPQTKKIEVITKLFNKLSVTFGSQLCKNSFVTISAHVSENARFYLYELMKRIGLENCLYVDTDSLKFREIFLPRLKSLVDDHKPGYLKLEDRFREFCIMGAKYYRTEHDTRIKGVPKKARKIGKYKYKYTMFPKQSTHLRYQVTRFFVTKPIIKIVKPKYDKGRVDDDGTITPFILNE